MKFSAVILAGGRSSRMGRDKAWLPLSGQPLLARQIALVRELAPAEVFISGRADTDYSTFGCPVLTDRFTDAGPLAGIAAGLAAAATPLVLVLAVDLPAMSARLLRELLENCVGGNGVVPRLAQRIEPLAAVYPKSAAALAVSLLQHQEGAAHIFASQCQQAGLVLYRELPATQRACFANWNSPEDMNQPPPSAPDLAAGQSAQACGRAKLAR